MRLVAWSTFEIVVLSGMVALAATVGVAVPWSQGHRVPAFSVLTLFGLFFVLLGRRQVRRKQLVREVTANEISGIWNDALQFSRPKTQSVGLLPRNLRDCQIGAEALIIWCQDLPFVVTASLFAERVDWLLLHAHIDQASRRPRAIRRLLLTASIVGWIALLVFAWNAWEAWAR